MGIELKIEYLPIETLTPYERNAKEHPREQIEQIKRSIQDNDMCDPVGIWGPDNTIVEGHGRVIACRELGRETVPCIRLDHLTDEQRREYALIHNQTTLTSGFDPELLRLEIGDLPGFDAEFYGFKAPEIAESIDDISEDEPPEDAPPLVQPGDLWQLGEHILICGDSTEQVVFDKLMGGVKADMVFTDPPYGVAIGDKNAVLNKVQGTHSIDQNIAGDTMNERELYDMLRNAFTNVREHCADDASYYVTSPQGGSLGLMMMMMMRDARLPVRHILIWVKNAATFSLGRLDYDYRHEPVFYTWTKNHKYYGEYSNTVIDDSMPIDKMSKAELKEQLRARLYQKENSVIYCDKPVTSKLHPTMKPIKLIARFLFNSSKKGDIVLDAFGGSGSTLMACEQTGRRCRMIELDPHYCDVILKRWEDFTGKKAVKIA